MLKAFQLSKGTAMINCTGRLLNCILKAQLHGQAQEWLVAGISGTCCSDLLCIMVCTRLGSLTATFWHTWNSLIHDTSIFGLSWEAPCCRQQNTWHVVQGVWWVRKQVSVLSCYSPLTPCTLHLKAVLMHEWICLQYTSPHSSPLIHFICRVTQPWRTEHWRAAECLYLSNC